MPPDDKTGVFWYYLAPGMTQDLGMTAQNIQAAPLALKCGGFFAALVPSLDVLFLRLFFRLFCWFLAAFLRVFLVSQNVTRKPKFDDFLAQNHARTPNLIFLT